MLLLYIVRDELSQPLGRYLHHLLCLRGCDDPTDYQTSRRLIGSDCKSVNGFLVSMGSLRPIVHKQVETTWVDI